MDEKDLLEKQRHFEAMEKEGQINIFSEEIIIGNVVTKLKEETKMCKKENEYVE